MDQVLSSALRDATLSWLDRLDTLICAADASSRTAIAETELLRMVAAWRALLAEHEPDEEGRCRRCARRRRRRRHLCSVWITAHQYLVVSDAPTSGIARHALTSGRAEASWQR